MPFAQHSIQKTSRSAITFLLSAVWLVLSVASSAELARLAPAGHSDLFRQLIAAGLLFGGFYLIARLHIADLRPLSSVGFVRRPGTGVEFARGLALGWGIAIALVLPALLTGNLSVSFGFDAGALLSTIEGLVVLVAFALAVQLVLAGLPARTLLHATSPTWTLLAVVILGTVLSRILQGASLPVSALAACLFVVAFLRTRAIWVGLGVQIGWTLSLQLLFGASSPYTPATRSIVSSYVSGPSWLTGYPYGPETSVTAIAILIAAIIVLYRMTKDYAWHYTWQPLDGAGHAVTVAPPAEHVREEAKHAAPLVQIGGIPPAMPPKTPLE